MTPSPSSSKPLQISEQAGVRLVGWHPRTAPVSVQFSNPPHPRVEVHCLLPTVPPLAMHGPSRIPSQNLVPPHPFASTQVTSPEHAPCRGGPSGNRTLVTKIRTTTAPNHHDRLRIVPPKG